MFVITMLANQNKHQIANFRDEDFTGALANVQKAIQANDKTEILNHKHKNYYSTIKQKYEMIMLMMDKFQPDQYQNILVEIVMFNDLHTTKWSRTYNNVQLNMFLQMCCALQNKMTK
ncbi:hypothetical protein Barb6_03099 [Bacteroidales bacterium Barb6]|nr:hypothetical protein Barb6_03099 [Bacteroidales bacterium Barb6]